MMTKTSMLVINNPNMLSRFLPRIVGSTLYVHFSPKRLFPSFGSASFLPPLLGPTVVSLYRGALSARRDLDLRVLLGSLRRPGVPPPPTKRPVEVVYFGDFRSQEEMAEFMRDGLSNKATDCEVVDLCGGQEEIPLPPPSPATSCLGMYSSVVLGGTFDRLHPGHKILLSESILRCQSKLTIGVTNAEMLRSKKLWELIEPCEERIERVRDFLEDVEPSLEYDIVPIGDMYGPTKDDPSFELLVVSSETTRGGDKVNEVRVKSGLKALDVHSVDLLTEEKLHEIEEDKISSSNDRLRLLGTLLKPPERRDHLPEKPYIIGLTGGIASGKSSVSEKLKGLGAGHVSCDNVAHELYVPGGPCFQPIVDAFGKKILTMDGSIDRKILGTIVFNDREKLEVLNSILWPAILQRSKEMAYGLAKNGHNVVVLEAAVLIKAGWVDQCHEIWNCIVPPEEAIKRVQSRNNLTQEEADARVSAQPSNQEYLSFANVVFCTLWSPDYTQKQVERAWNELQSRLGSSSRYQVS